MVDIIVIAVLLIIVGLAISYIRKEKKRGVRCIGCPAAATCPSAHAGKCSGGCQSNTHTDD